MKKRVISKRVINKRSQVVVLNIIESLIMFLVGFGLLSLMLSFGSKMFSEMIEYAPYAYLIIGVYYLYHVWSIWRDNPILSFEK